MSKQQSAHTCTLTLPHLLISILLLFTFPFATLLLSVSSFTFFHVFPFLQATLLSSHPEIATTVVTFQPTASASASAAATASSPSASTKTQKNGLTILKGLLVEQTNTFLCGNAALALGLCIKDKKEFIPMVMGK